MVLDVSEQAGVLFMLRIKKAIKGEILDSLGKGRGILVPVVLR